MKFLKKWPFAGTICRFSEILKTNASRALFSYYYYYDYYYYDYYYFAPKSTPRCRSFAGNSAIWVSHFSLTAKNARSKIGVKNDTV